MSSSNYDGNYQYWTNPNIYGYEGDESSGTSSHFNHVLYGDHHAEVDSTTPPFTHHQCLPAIDIEAAAKGEKKLGLKLTKTPSLLNIMDGFKTSRGKKKQDNEDDSNSSDKLKAANFSALSIQIGSWKRESRHEGDLVAKCYFKKRKLVWEALEGNLKTKIEFLWSNILALRQRNCPTSKTKILEVMLERSPMFFREVNPQPRKHTNWEQTDDFTSNQASLIRKHVLEFAPGVLEKHFDKIVQADPKLHRLSQQAWPNHISPCFHEIRFTNGIHFEHSPMIIPPHYSYNPTITPQNPSYIEGMDSRVNNHSDYYPSTNYPIQDSSYNQNISQYQLGELSISSDDCPPNVYDNQSQFYTSAMDFNDINQNVNYVQEQQLSYEPNLPYSYATSDAHDVGYYQSSNHDYQSQYYHDVGGNQWQ